MPEQEPESMRADLAETLRRRKLIQDESRGEVVAAPPSPAPPTSRENLAAPRADESRGEVVAARHSAARRTARENLAALCDDGSFVEYGGLAIAAQRGRRTVDDLVQRTPADGLIAGRSEERRV